MNKQETGVVTIELYRHGHSEKNQDNRIVGGRQIHSPLTPKGEAQAVVLGQSFKERLSPTGELFNAAYSSEAVRAVRTGMIALHAAGIELPIITKPGLNELSKGVWEGQVRNEPLEYNGQTICYPSRQETTWYSNVPGGESYADVATRKIQTLVEIGEAHAPGDRIAVFGHAIATRCVIAALYDRDFTWFERKLSHCTYTTFSYSPDIGLQLTGLPPE